MNLFESTKHSDETDEFLLAQYKSGRDLAILGDLYQRHTEMIYYVCYRYFKDSERSKDAVMQIFEELVKKVDRQEIQSFQKWIYVVAKNHCLMQLRSEKVRQVDLSENFVEFSVVPHPEDDREEKERQLQSLERCIEKLPEKQKQAVELFFLQEKCYKDIASLTGYSMDGVKSYIQNGKRNLKLCIEKDRDEQ